MKPITILSFFLILMVGTRLGNTYFSPSGRLRAPEQNFATETLGRDFQDYSVTAWHTLSRGQTPVIFGYGSVLLAAVGLRYQGMVAVSLIGLFVLLLVFVKEKNTRILALLGFGIFLLGVPMNKAIEAGNPDLFLSVLFGFILLMLRKRTQTHTYSFLRSMTLGVLLGFFLNVKGFLLLFVLATLVLSGPDFTLLLWFCISFAANALWPWMYGVKSGMFDVFIFAVRGSQADAQTTFTQIHYGNNAIMPYISNILQAFDRDKIPMYMHQILTYIGSTILALFIYVKPFFDERFTISAGLIKRSYSLFSFSLFVYTVCYIIMLTAPAWSYDYRILYVLPLIFCFLGQSRDRHTTQLLYLSILSLLTKSLFIPKDRTMTVFLYLHFYFLLRAALSLWKKEVFSAIHRKNSLRFV